MNGLSPDLTAGLRDISPDGSGLCTDCRSQYILTLPISVAVKKKKKKEDHWKYFEHGPDMITPTIVSCSEFDLNSKIKTLYKKILYLWNVSSFVI